MVDQPRASEPRRTLALIVAVEIVDPLAIAYNLGDARWVATSGQLADRMRELAGPAQVMVAPGSGEGVALFDRTEHAFAFGAQVLAAGRLLELPVSAAVHAGEIFGSGREPGGVHIIAAQQAARLAGAGALIVTEPAMAMSGNAVDRAFDAGEWRPAGLPVTWRLYIIGSHGLKDPDPPSGDAAAAGLRFASLLTVRERQVVLLVADGLSNQEIAGCLAIAVSTVERHLANIYRKLKFRSRAQLARWAIVQGIAEGPPIVR